MLKYYLFGIFILQVTNIGYSIEFNKNAVLNEIAYWKPISTNTNYSIHFREITNSYIIKLEKLIKLHKQKNNLIIAIYSSLKSKDMALEFMETLDLKNLSPDDPLYQKMKETDENINSQILKLKNKKKFNIFKSRLAFLFGKDNFPQISPVLRKCRNIEVQGIQALIEKHNKAQEVFERTQFPLYKKKCLEIKNEITSCAQSKRYNSMLDKFILSILISSKKLGLMSIQEESEFMDSKDIWEQFSVVLPQRTLYKFQKELSILPQYKIEK